MHFIAPKMLNIKPLHWVRVMEKQALALFDFDGTLTTRDTMFEFIAFTHGKKALRKALAQQFFTLVMMQAGWTKAQHAKEKLLAHFYKGRLKTEMLELGQRFCETCIPELLKPEALKKLRWHREEGHQVLVVSASCSEWIQAWCDVQCLPLLSSQMAYGPHGFTGVLAGKNCNGEEKVRRIKAYLRKVPLGTVYAYGDSKGDNAMLAFSERPFYRCFQ